MKKARWLSLVTLASVLLLAACGDKSQEEVIEELDETLQTMSGYQTEATMTMQTGQEPRQYDVEIAHMQNEENRYYRVELQNEDEEQNQMILRNDEGVFLLTPALNKSFRFQSDWPNNNSQIYLYESLIGDILTDTEREFAVEEDRYVFETNTNYQNQNLHQQEIVLNSDDLSPHAVRVFDEDYNTLVEVVFESFTLNETLEREEFDMDANMESGEEGEEPTAVEEEEEGATTFDVFMPSHEPANTELAESEEVETDVGKRVILTYEGDQPFTIIQQPASISAASGTSPTELGYGEPEVLGDVVGVMSEETLTWTSGGIEFIIASDSMESEEMSAIAESMTSSSAK
ncbi:outer membrane lipoprotein carrier protein LolA [Salicibibacter cibarius]|uniref:Outer membrane lipoprotein carrier protein LolA n=1 Tax=Salicibibacter cibarius TaxID=2743000 RepID=A0A7T6Z1G4_9BACI|nr:outer membrane lipoprotein carrier protein LolA [Salicibibacter cibarius]QQK75211.1 outer membrane lipoprotein carrier protein LolA [Salicibibacter cibarius]